MDILTEQAATYEKCMERIKAKYGPNVRVMRQQKIRMGGLFGFGEHDGIELQFVLQQDVSQVMQPYTYSPQNPVTMTRQASFNEERKNILMQAARTSPEMATKVASHLAAVEGQSAKAPPRTPPATAADRDSLEKILRAVRSLEAKIDRGPAENETRAEDHESIARIGELLELNDFSPSYIKAIVSKAKAEFTLEQLDDYDTVQDTVLEWIGRSIAVSDNRSSAKPRVIVLVGPTGVGKTTTVAKLAAAYSLAASKGSRPLNVRVITIDNYRIGAKQQIEIYGNIMNIPVSCAERPDDLKALMAMYAQDVDIVLIDTIGKSPRDYTKIAEMRQFLDAAGTVSDIHLAMSATTKASDMREIMQQYETFGYRSVIITKFDETTRVGNIISVLGEKKKPLAYITTGQRVPQDFEQASAVRFLTNLEGFRVNRARIEELFPLDENSFVWR